MYVSNTYEIWGGYGPDLGSDGVNCLCTGLNDAVFSIFDENNSDNTLIP